jgi:cell division protein FtsQ
MSAGAMNRLAAIFVGLAVLALGAAALSRLAQQPKFQLKRVDIRGDLRHVTASSVRAALAGRLRGNYFTLRLDDTRRLFETVPWVAEASVRRVWPDRLMVTLTEHRALGVWEDGRLLSDRGELFVANPDEAEIYGQLPEFSGPFSAAKEAARRYYELSAQFAPLSLQIAAIDISDRKAWSLRLSPDLRGDSKHPNDLHVELGRDRAALPLAERVAQLVAAYPLVVAQLGNAPVRIDARYANGLAASGPAKAMKSDRTVRP